MDLPRLFLSFCLAFCLCSPTYSQLEIKAGVKTRLDGSGFIQIGERVYLDAGVSLSSSQVGIVRVITEAANIQVDVSDEKRTPYQAEEIAKGTYEISKPGKWWVDVTVIDFQKNLYGKKSTVLEIGPGPEPNPPEPGPTPDPPGPSPVPNDYGIGAVAYKYAVRGDRSTLAKYASIYKQSADFLDGKPSLKSIVSDNVAHSADPNRSVLAWIKREYDSTICTDQKTCEAWTQWRALVSQALTKAQQAKQFTRVDWQNAFREIVTALEAVR